MLQGFKGDIGARPYNTLKFHVTHRQGNHFTIMQKLWAKVQPL